MASFASIDVGALEISFDDLAFIDDQVHLIPNTYKQEGFEIYTDASPASNWHVYGEFNSNYAGSAGIYTNAGFGTGVYLYYRPIGTETNYFDAISVDMTRAYFNNYASFNVTFIGKFYDGRPSVSQVFTVNGTSTTFETFYFNDEFKGVRQLFIYSGGNPQAQFDNFNISLSPVPGDINNDGLVNVGDLLLMQRYILNLITLDTAAIERGDLYPENSGDGSLTVSDFLLLMQLLKI